MKKIGFIGLGQMGKWMSLNLVKAGFDVWVLDINPEAVTFLTDQGAKAFESPAEMAQRVEVIFMSLPNTEIVESVVLGEKGIIHGAKEGLIVVDLSTIGYLPTLEIARRLRQRKIAFADAPVSGMEMRAKEGALTIMFGGEESVFETLRPAFNAIGNSLVYMGAVGSGQLTKLINQLLFNISCAGVAEVLPMAAKLGLDPEKITQVITTGTGRSFAAEFFVPLALENRFDEGYPIKHAYKDLISAAEISVHKKIPLPLVHATTTTFQMALAEGLGDENKGSLIKVFERKLGVEFRKKEKNHEPSP
ncbi:MAG: NAD-binding protein [Deltaproteobacteria bacterium]|nr:NAD-binding protein [Deltaproteobacteria bacterium]